MLAKMKTKRSDAGGGCGGAAAMVLMVNKGGCQTLAVFKTIE